MISDKMHFYSKNNYFLAVYNDSGQNLNPYASIPNCTFFASNYNNINNLFRTRTYTMETNRSKKI